MTYFILIGIFSCQGEKHRRGSPPLDPQEEIAWKFCEGGVPLTVENNLNIEVSQCGLVMIRQQGRERFCQVNLRPLAEVSGWFEKYRAFWTGKWVIKRG